MDMINLTINEFSHAYVTSLLSDIKNLIKCRRTSFAMKALHVKLSGVQGSVEMAQTSPCHVLQFVRALVD
jgi:hypothetical protein